MRVSGNPPATADRVLVLSCDPGIPLLGPSGSSAHLRAMVHAMNDMGLRVNIALPRMSDHRGTVAPPPPIPALIDEPSSTSGRPRWQREIAEWRDGGRLAARVIDECEPTRIIYERHSLFGSSGATIAAAWRKQGHQVAHVLELNAPLADERRANGHLANARTARWLEGKRLRKADRVVAVSSWLARWARRRGVARHKVITVPNGAAEVRRTGGGALKQSLGINGPVLGFVGSMKPWHGLERIPEILHHLPDTHVLAIGTGPVAVPVHPRIHRLGYRTGADLDAAIDATDVAIAPYASSAPAYFSPLKIAQWRWAGIPIVAPRLGDLPTLIGDGGVIVDGDSPELWARAVRLASRIEVVPKQRPWSCVVREAIGDLITDEMSEKGSSG